MSNNTFYDFDTTRDGEIEPKNNRDDLLDEDTPPVICDNCNDGRLLIPYQKDKLICPLCMNVYNPAFEHIKHDTIETTIEEEANTNTGQISYTDDTKDAKPPITKIRKKLEKEELPDYVKQEIENIHYRPGYKTVPLSKKLSHTIR